MGRFMRWWFRGGLGSLAGSRCAGSVGGQRCWVQKTANVLNKMLKSLQAPWGFAPRGTCTTSGWRRPRFNGCSVRRNGFFFALPHQISLAANLAQPVANLRCTKRHSLGRCQDHVGGLLRYHDNRGIDVARGHSWHHRSIDHS